jgi:signal transducing adaptor molecule
MRVLSLTITRLGVSFEDPPESPHGPSDEQLKREEEEIQRAIEASQREAELHRGAGLGAGYKLSDYTLPSANGSTSKLQDLRKPDPAPTQAPAQPQQSQLPTTTAALTPSSSGPSRVRALYDFDPSEEGELRLLKGDIVRVIDSAYQGWWRGERGGQVGIFPVNYVVRFERGRR